jgi:hypothetical protein
VCRPSARRPIYPDAYAADVLLLLTRDVCADDVVSHDGSVRGSESDQ